MARLRNLPTDQVKKFASLIDVKDQQVISMSLTDSDNVDMVMLSFGAGEGVSEEVYQGDTMYLILDGEVTIRKEEQDYHLCKGDTIMVEADIPHEILGKNAYKIVQITVH